MDEVWRTSFSLNFSILLKITPLISISEKSGLPHIYNGTYFLSFYFQAQCSDPGSPDHGRRRGNIFRHNSWVQFFCNVHYTLHGEEWIQCIDGSWSTLLPKCLGKPATLDGMFFIGLCISVMIYWNPFGVTELIGRFYARDVKVV